MKTNTILRKVLVALVLVFTLVLVACAKADFTNLQSAITSASEKVEAEYTSASWDALEEALTGAQTVLANEKAKQEEVDAALAALQSAVEALVKRGDKTQLNALVAEVEALDSGLYTASTWAAVSNALTAAKAVAANADAVQADIDAAKTALNNAKAALAQKTDEELSAVEWSVTEGYKMTDDVVRYRADLEQTAVIDELKKLATATVAGVAASADNIQVVNLPQRNAETGLYPVGKHTITFKCLGSYNKVSEKNVEIEIIDGNSVDYYFLGANLEINNANWKGGAEGIRVAANNFYKIVEGEELPLGLANGKLQDLEDILAVQNTTATAVKFVNSDTTGFHYLLDASGKIKFFYDGANGAYYDATGKTTGYASTFKTHEVTLEQGDIYLVIGYSANGNWYTPFLEKEFHWADGRYYSRLVLFDFNNRATASAVVKVVCGETVVTSAYQNQAPFLKEDKGGVVIPLNSTPTDELLKKNLVFKDDNGEWGAAYVDPASITVSHQINIAVEGQYDVTYTVSDGTLSTTYTRKVTVKALTGDYMSYEKADGSKEYLVDISANTVYNAVTTHANQKGYISIYDKEYFEANKADATKFSPCAWSAYIIISENGNYVKGANFNTTGGTTLAYALANETLEDGQYIVFFQQDDVLPTRTFALGLISAYNERVGEDGINIIDVAGLTIKDKPAEVLTYTGTYEGTATQNLDGTWSVTVDFAQWNRIQLTYAGTVLDKNNTTWTGAVLPGNGNSGGLRGLYTEEGDQSLFLHGNGYKTEYTLVYTPATKTVNVTMSIADNQFTAHNQNGDSTSAYWTEAGTVLIDWSAESKFITPNGWRFFLVVTKDNKIAYACLNPANGRGTYYCHPDYALENPAVSSVEGGIKVVIPEGGFAITAHNTNEYPLQHVLDLLTGGTVSLTAEDTVYEPAFNCATSINEYIRVYGDATYGLVKVEKLPYFMGEESVKYEFITAQAHKASKGSDIGGGGFQGIRVITGAHEILTWDDAEVVVNGANVAVVDSKGNIKYIVTRWGQEWTKTNGWTVPSGGTKSNGGSDWTYGLNILASYVKPHLAEGDTIIMASQYKKGINTTDGSWRSLFDRILMGGSGTGDSRGTELANLKDPSQIKVGFAHTFVEEEPEVELKDPRLVITGEASAEAAYDKEAGTLTVTVAVPRLWGHIFINYVNAKGEIVQLTAANTTMSGAIHHEAAGDDWTGKLYYEDADPAKWLTGVQGGQAYTLVYNIAENTLTVTDGANEATPVVSATVEGWKHIRLWVRNYLYNPASLWALGDHYADVVILDKNYTGDLSKYGWGYYMVIDASGKIVELYNPIEGKLYNAENPTGLAGQVQSGILTGYDYSKLGDGYMLLFPNNDHVLQEGNVKPHSYAQSVQENDWANRVVTLTGFVLESEQPKEEVTYVVNASELDKADLTANTVLVEGVISILAKDDMKNETDYASHVTIDGNNKSADGFEFTQRIKLNGTAKADCRVIKFELTGAATIEVYAMSGSSSSDRTLQLYDASFTAIEGQGQTALGASLSKLTYEVSEAGTYLLGSASSGINIYYIKVTMK